MKLLVATSNANKVREITPVLVGLDIELVTLVDVPPVPEPEESGATFWENARIKALAYARATGLTAVAEDSGLVVDALGGQPGVLSARFLGPATAYPVRFEEIWRRLAAQPAAARTARFVTALALASGDDILFECEAAIEGEIATAASGTHGFGYDPIFRYPPFGRTTADLPLEVKSAVSHRGRAFRDFARWLRESRKGEKGSDPFIEFR